jgi:hypothetical protein
MSGAKDIRVGRDDCLITPVLVVPLKIIEET